MRMPQTTWQLKVMSSEDSASDVEWEDVEPLETGDPVSTEPTEEQLLALASLSKTSDGPVGSIEITLGGDGKRNKEKDMFEKSFEALKRQLRYGLHKVHLLCLLSHGLHTSKVCDNPTLQSVLLSILVNEKDLYKESPLQYTSDSFLRLLKWFCNERDRIEKADQECCMDVSVTQMLVALLRVMGLRTRLVMVLHPLSHRPPLLGKKKSYSTSSASSQKVKGRSGKEPSSTTPCNTADCSKVTRKQTKRKKSTKIKNEEPTRHDNEAHGDSDPTVSSSRDISGTLLEKHTRSSSRNKSSVSKTPEKEGPSVSTTKCHTSPYFKKKLKLSKPPALRKRSLSETETQNDSEYTPLSTGSHTIHTHSNSPNESSGEEFAPPVPKRKKGARTGSIKNTKAPKKAVKRAKAPLVNSQSNSPSSSTQTKNQSVPEQTSSKESSSWAEVFVTSKKKWVCVHLPSCSVGQPHLCERDSPLPLNYVIAFETGSNGVAVRDVTPRYASDWCTRTYKQRLDRDWWAESLRPIEPSSQEKGDEDEEIIAQLYAQPLPSAVSDYKNHPLYALKRHLLKFEAIYPEDSEILGYCRGEPVYARECVHMLHTRETWLKEGRMVRVDETAFQSVKARPKKGQSVLEAQQSTVEVFGKWQTEEYIAHPIVDGKVPRNVYGNVELFQPSMLPPGGVHIKIQGIQKVARKLEVDYAPAMMGWDFHGGYCHPIIEGIVVAQENEGLLLEAWEQEEQIKMDKQLKKRERRMVDRWRKLTKSLLIRERLRQKYNQTD